MLSNQIHSIGQSRVTGRLSRTLSYSLIGGLLLISFAYLTWSPTGNKTLEPDTRTGARTEPPETPLGNVPDEMSARTQYPSSNESGLRVELILRGIFLADNFGTTHALIEDQYGNEGRYQVGDLIGNGIEVREILANKVIIARGESLETLLLWSGDEQSIPMRQAGVDDARTSSGAGGPLIRTRPAVLTDLVSPQPVYAAGRFTGFRLNPLKRNDPLRQFGLRPEDVVIQVNGVGLDNPLMGLRMLRQVKAGDYVSLTVRRNGQIVSLAFDVPR